MTIDFAVDYAQTRSEEIYQDRQRCWSAEVYTNADPLTYVELEMLGPLQEMKVSDKLERANIYMLARRTRAVSAKKL